MINWTLFVCVLIALSPTASADNKIDAKCDTSDKNGPDWNGVATNALGIIGGFIPGLSEISGIASGVIGMWGAAHQPDGFSKQWEKCIMGWIDHEIEAEVLREAITQLTMMGTIIDTEIMPYIEEDNLSDTKINDIADSVRTLHYTYSNDIRAKVGGVKNPSEFLIAYDAALLNELTASYLFIAKLNNMTYDPFIINDYADILANRMNETETYLHDIDNIYFKEGDIPFWGSWNIDFSIYEGNCDFWQCELDLGFYEIIDSFKCTVTDPTGRTGEAFECKDACEEQGFWEICGYKDSCNPNKCNDELAKRRSRRDNAQDNVRKLLDSMKTLTEKARTNFVAQTKRMKLSHGTDGMDCPSQCSGSEYDVKCLKRCHLLAKKV